MALCENYIGVNNSVQTLTDQCMDVELWKLIVILLNKAEVDNTQVGTSIDVYRGADHQYLYIMSKPKSDISI